MDEKLNFSAFYDICVYVLFLTFSIHVSKTVVCSVATCSTTQKCWNLCIHVRIFCYLCERLGPTWWLFLLALPSHTYLPDENKNQADERITICFGTSEEIQDMRTMFPLSFLYWHFKCNCVCIVVKSSFHSCWIMHC